MPSTRPYPGCVVKSGDTDKPLVRFVQQQLNDLKCSELPLTTDGDFGRKIVDCKPGLIH